jgi:hypothetical protein
MSDHHGGPVSTPITILEPTNAVSARAATLASRPARLGGLRLGVLDNGKPNSDRFLTLLAERLVRVADIDLTQRHRKPSIGRLAPAEIIDELAAACDIVVTGVGDCAGCCSCTVGDAVALERLGVPVAAVCTSEFLTAASLAAAAVGAPGYQLAVIDHPFGSCTDSQLADRASEAVDQVRRLLLADVGSPLLVVDGGRTSA